MEQPLRRLALLKTAIRSVSTTMVRQRRAASIALASTHDDKIGHTMRFIRAVEDGRLEARRRCIRAYPHLGTLAVDPLSPALQAGDGLAPFRDHAVELARERAIEALQDLHSHAQVLLEAEAQRRRWQIHRQLKLISPGRSTGLAAVQRSDGTVVTDPEEMATALREHWAEVFTARPRDGALLSRWMAEEFPEGSGLPPLSDARWRVRRRDVARAIALSPNSAPGPDGIPYAAWRRLGPLAIDLLAAVSRDLSTESGPAHLQELCSLDPADIHDFNMGLLVLLPKAPAGQTDEGVDYYTAGDVRPLSLVNCDNRILANALRMRLNLYLASGCPSVSGASCQGVPCSRMCWTWRRR